jgi:hypothetical protein
MLQARRFVTLSLGGKKVFAVSNFEKVCVIKDFIA